VLRKWRDGAAYEKDRGVQDPRLFALALVAEHMAHRQQALVPERVLMMGGGDGSPLTAVSLFGKLLALLLADKAGMGLEGDGAELTQLRRAVEGFGAQPTDPPAQHSGGGTSAAPAA
jgi:hypothetical protein